MKYLSLFFLLLGLISCSEVKKQDIIISKKTHQSIKFFPKFYSKDTLRLDVMIDDCGEWGGSEDEFRIYMDSLRQYVLDFKRYKMNCDSISFYYGKQRPLELKKKIVLNDTTKKVISNLLLNIMQGKIEEYNGSNGGSVYQLYTNDSTLFVRVHSTEKQMEEQYYDFKRRLGLPENRKRDNKIIIPVD